MKVLIVDDHALITTALSALLLDLDPAAEVHTAASATAAADLVARHGEDADLLLLDLGLPGVEGTRLLESFVEHYPDLKILVLSGLQDPRSVMRVLQLGAAGFVPKSMDSDMLATAIRFVLGGGVYIPSNLLEEAQRSGLLATPAPAVSTLAGRAVDLTERQREVLNLLARGAPIKQICRELHLSEGTVKTHVTAIYRAFGASNRTEALLAARRHGYDAI
ncbi:MAG: response regulator transcription factor [Burkholderiaceae bacterium]